MSITYTIIIPILLALWVYHDAKNEGRTWLWALGVMFMAPVFFSAYFWTKAPVLNWKCPDCGNKNSASVKQCQNCEFIIDKEKQKTLLRGHWKISDVVAIILLGQFVSQLVSMFIFVWNNSPNGEIFPESTEDILDMLKPSTIWLAQLFGSNVILALSLYCVNGRYNWDLKDVGIKFSKPIRYLLIAVGLAIFFLIVQQIFVNLGLKIGKIIGTSQIKELFEKEAEIQQKGFPENITDAIFPLLFFTAVILVPVSEEILFRGMAYTVLKKKFGVNRGILLSALLFSLLHQMVFYFVPIFLMGIVFAYVYEKTKSLLPSILSHALINLFAMIITIYTTR